MTPRCGFVGCDDPPEYVVRVDDPVGIDSAIAACRIHAKAECEHNPDAKVKPLP